MKKYFVIGLISLIVIPLHAQKLSTAEREILQLQDQRSLGNGALVGYLSNTNSDLRFRALIALANIQDTSTIFIVEKLLSDNVPLVRSAAAFAIGQIGVGSASQDILNALKLEKDSLVQNRMLEALGKCGSAKILDSLTDYFSATSRALSCKDLAMSYSRFALRGIKSERSIWQSIAFLEDNGEKGKTNSEIRWRALYALWRSAPYGLVDLEIDKNIDLFERLAKDPDPNVRMNLAILFSKSNAKCTPELLDLLESAEIGFNDWRVIVQILKAQAAIITSDGKAFGRIANFIYNVNDHIKITALQSISAVPVETIIASGLYASLGKELRLVTERAYNDTEPVRGEALVTLGKHYPEILDSQDSLYQTTKISLFMKRKYIEATAQRYSKKHFNILMNHLDDESIRISMAAWDYGKPFLKKNIIQSFTDDSASMMKIVAMVGESALKALAHADMALTTVVANVGSDPATSWLFLDKQQNARITDALMKALSSFNSSDDIESRIAIINSLAQIGTERCIPLLQAVVESSSEEIADAARTALKKISGKDYVGKASKPESVTYTDRDWSKLESIPVDQRIEFTTSKGKFVLRISKEYSPFTVLSMVRLIEKKFYDGLTFHRIVPNFVVQGGDPRGDGWGGPGFTLRTEVALVGFDEGMCGIASAGKDTEGCQFFITQSPAPHLDGRYTIFAKVVSGMDTVNRIQVGDVIISARLLN